MIPRTLLSWVCVMACAGCATDEALRKSSGDLALRIDQTAEEAGNFVAARTHVMKARTATLNALEANALASEQSNQVEISYRAAAGDTAWVELVERLRKAPDLMAQQRRDQVAAAAAAETSVRNARSAADFKTAKLAEASRALATLSEDQKDAESLAFYIGYVRDVNKAINDKAVQASEVASAAAGASAKKAEEAATQSVATKIQKNVESSAGAASAPK